MNTLHKIILWGADNYNLLGLLRSLSVDQFDIVLLINGKKHNIATASKYCKKYYITSSIEEGVNYLIKNYPEYNEPHDRAILIPGGDSTSIGTAENYNVLYKRFHLMCTKDPNTLMQVTDKNVMGKIASECGLLVPLSQKFSDKTDNYIVPFPAILKPVHTEGRIEFKTRIVENLKDLLNLKKILNGNNSYILQQYIDKEYDVVIYGCRLENGDLYLAGHHTLERWSSDGGGSYGHLYPDIPDYLQPDALKRFFDTIDYHGLFSAEYGFKDGKAYFYEVNLRNDGFCHLSFQAGANLPLLWVDSCLGIPFNGSSKMTKSVVAINEVYDVINVWDGNITWKKYKSDLKEAEAFHFYDTMDPKPYKNMHKRMFWEIPFRAIIKKFRPQIVWILKKLGL